MNLLRRTHDQLANEKQLHLVEFRKENLMYPRVVASPIVVRKAGAVASTETMDFTQYVLGGKVVLKRKEFPRFYVNLRSYKLYQKKKEYLRNQDQVKLRLYADHGELRSYLTDDFPEARPKKFWCKKESEELE
ncbi:hypothetical protein QAD02_020387 [Eretmocerus hayati]|uniref:Uncharacterized protein n=1 Tax=Eretmocerus hayati TaxID=131215 RepID=A0ACC2PLX0_9HYME|nr:hypothetical protein QAD02_020387 [Eretmocerus hayati]